MAEQQPMYRAYTIVERDKDVPYWLNNCDITEQVKRDALSRGGQLTPDGRGYFGIVPGLKAHFEVLLI